MIKNPKGRSSAAAIIAVVVYVVVAVATAGFGGVGALLFTGELDVLGIGAPLGLCAAGVFWGCSNSKPASAGGSSQVQAGAACSSASNACGMTNMGSVIDNGNGTGSCNATPPPNSACPAPTINGGGGFYANPSTIGTNSQTTLYWNAANASACKIDGDNGFHNEGAASGSVLTGVLAQTTTFTLDCQDGAGGPETSASLRVILDPHYQEI